MSDRNQLKADLDLAAGLEAADDEAGFVPAAPAVKEPSPTALALDRWSIRRGAELASAPEWREALEMSEADDAADGLLAADLRAAAYEPDPQLAPEPCEDALRRQYVEELLQTPDWHAMRSSSVYDDMASDLAATVAAKRFLALAEEQAQPNPPDREIACMQAAAEATREAKAEVSGFQESCRGLGGTGGTDGKLDPGVAAKLFKRIRNSSRLRGILNRTGRYRRLTQAQQRRKSIHGRDDVVGIVQDGDLARLVPSELAQLADDDTELLALRRLLERQSLCREYRGIEPVGKGPIVACIDESGSMDGERIENAKAIALSLAWIAQKQNRWCALVSFSDKDQPDYYLALPPGKWDQDALCDWLEHFYGGGTDMNMPLATVPTKCWAEFTAQGMPRGQTDIVVITDAIVRIPTDMERSFLDWKQREQVKLVSLIIGEREAGDLARVSDTVHLVPLIDVEQGAVAEVLSV